MVQSVKRGGIITSKGTQDDDNFYRSLANRLGVDLRSCGCGNGCYLRVILEMLGCKVKCKQELHEFGQPVHDVDEATRFLRWQLQLDKSHLDSIKKIA